MRGRQVTLGVVLLVVGGALVVGTTVGFGTITSDTAAETNESDEQFGLEMTSFAQSSASEAEGAVENGMWEVRMNVSDRPGDEIRNRTHVLEDRLAALEQRRAQLEADRENMSEIAYTAQATRTRAEIANLRSATNQTHRTATQHGINVTTLERLQNDARNMTGPEVAEVARQLTDTPRGPPDRAGPPGENGSPGEGDGDGNDTDRTGSGEPGPPGHGNDSDRPGNGPPDGDDDESETGEDSDRTHADEQDTDSTESGDRGSNR